MVSRHFTAAYLRGETSRLSLWRLQDHITSNRSSYLRYEGFSNASFTLVNLSRSKIGQCVAA